jgi:hypothetical protein
MSGRVSIDVAPLAFGNQGAMVIIQVTPNHYSNITVMRFYDIQAAITFSKEIAEDPYSSDDADDMIKHYQQVYAAFIKSNDFDRLTKEDAGSLLMSMATEPEIDDLDHNTIEPAGRPGTLATLNYGDVLILSPHRDVPDDEVIPGVVMNDVQVITKDDHAEDIASQATIILKWDTWSHHYVQTTVQEAIDMIKAYQHDLILNAMYDDILTMSYDQRIEATRRLIAILTR